MLALAGALVSTCSAIVPRGGLGAPTGEARGVGTGPAGAGGPAGLGSAGLGSAAGQLRDSDGSLGAAAQSDGGVLAPRGSSSEQGAGMARFVARLRQLAAGSAKEPVRVLWMGDSHAAADFWTGSVRATLGVYFGVGGPGFVYLGLPVYRHGRLRVERSGKWRTRPKLPSYWEAQDDGVFGLGGIRAEPEGTEAKVTVSLLVGAVTGGARWDLAYRLPAPEARLVVQPLGGAAVVLAAGAPAPAGPEVRHWRWESAPGASVTLSAAGGAPQVLGLVIESQQPGLVVDVLGINGARVNTPLAWAEDAWLDEVRARQASLVVFAYGTNEVGDALAPWRYGEMYDRLLARVRRASPDIDCLLVGPTDRAAPDWTTHPRVTEVEAVQRAAAERLGCGFFSALVAMGGPGALAVWARESPPRAASDRVHLTPRGYATLGEATSSWLLERYEAKGSAAP